MTNDRRPRKRWIDALASLLAGVDRPGDFCVHGAPAILMPMVRKDDVGTLSLPLPESQADASIAAAERAPYGRDERIVVDTSVRRAWQTDGTRVHVPGKT